MRSLRRGQLATVTVAALIIGALPFGITRAEMVSKSVTPTYSKSNDVEYGSLVRISLGFEAPVDHQKSMLTLKSARGDRQLRPRLESAPNYLFVSVGHLPPGDYELVWQALLSDGQHSRGAISFTVKSRQDIVGLGKKPSAMSSQIRAKA